MGQSSAAAANLLIGNTTTLKYTTGGTASTDRSFTLNNGAANGNNFTLDASGAGAINWTNTASPAYQNADYSLTLRLAGANTNNNTLASNIANNGTGAVAIQKNDAGTWVLSGTNAYTGQTTVTDGTLKLTGNRTVAPTTTTAISVSGSNAILEFGGDFYSDNKQISVSGSGIINQTAGAVAFLGGVSYGGNQLVVGATTAGTYSLSGGSLTTTGSSGENRGIMIASGTTSGTSTFNLSGTGNLNVSGSSGGSGYKDSVLDLIRSDNTGTTGSTATFNQTGSGSIASVSILRMGSSGAGNTANLNLSAGTFTATKFDKLSFGGTTVSNINISGTANVTLPEYPQTGLGIGSTAVITFNNGTLKNAAASTNYLGVITSAYIKNGGAKLNTTGGNITITQALQEDTGSTGGGLTKEGTNTLTLSGTNTYTGATTITGGKMTIDSTGTINNSSSVTIGTASTSATTEFNYNATTALSQPVSFAASSTGGKISGNGVITSSVTITSGNTLAPGNSIESLGTGALTLAAGSTFAYELNKDAATANESGDLAFITGNLSIDLTNAAVLTLAELGVGAGTWDLNEKLTLLSYTGNWNGGLFTYGDTLTDGEIFSFSGANWQFNYDDTSEGANYTADSAGSYVTMTVIPEPGAALLGSLGILALLRRKRN